MTAIWGSRQKAKLALKKNQPTPEVLAGNAGIQNNEENVNAKPLGITDGALKNTNGKEPNVR